MAIQFACRKCGQTLRVEDQHAGAKTRCPRCGEISKAPSSSTPPAAPKTQTPADKSARRKPVKKTLADLVVGDEEPVNLVNKNREEADMDMTPMIDVTFLLLIFFMVTISYNMQKSLPMPPPSEDAAARAEPVDPEDGNVLVDIDQDGSVWINETEARSKQDLVIKIREAKEGVPGSNSPPITSLLVKANKKARYETLVMALDAGNEAGMEPIKVQFVEDDQ